MALVSDPRPQVTQDLRKWDTCAKTLLQGPRRQFSSSHKRVIFLHKFTFFDLFLRESIFALCKIDKGLQGVPLPSEAAASYLNTSYKFFVLAKVWREALEKERWKKSPLS